MIYLVKTQLCPLTPPTPLQHLSAEKKKVHVSWKDKIHLPLPLHAYCNATSRLFPTRYTVQWWILLIHSFHREYEVWRYVHCMLITGPLVICGMYLWTYVYVYVYVWKVCRDMYMYMYIYINTTDGLRRQTNLKCHACWHFAKVRELHLCVFESSILDILDCTALHIWSVCISISSLCLPILFLSYSSLVLSLDLHIRSAHISSIMAVPVPALCLCLYLV